jgi:hypothetical protein
VSAVRENTVRLTIRNAYPAEWPLVSYAVKLAAGWRCIRCGHLDPRRGGGQGRCDKHCTHSPDGKPRVLTVHHLDGDKANLAWWNLLALCQVCHLGIQARVIPERRWLWEHSPWFRIYVAGFYAAFYGGLEIGRDEAESRIEELLLLGQPWRALA